MRTREMSRLMPTAPDKGADKGAVKAVMASAVADDAALCTDGSGLLASAARALDIEHQPVNLSKGQRVRGAWPPPESAQAVAAPLQRRGQFLPRERPGLVPSARPVEGPVLKTPHGCSRWQSRSEVIISQQEQSQDTRDSPMRSARQLHYGG